MNDQPNPHARAMRGRWIQLGLGIALLLGMTQCTSAHHGRGQHHLPNVKEYVEHLDRPERDESQKPAEVIAALGLTPGLSVADLGAGSGYFTWRFAQAVGPTGTVFAVDIEPEMESYIRASVTRAERPAPVRFVLAEPNDPGLSPQSVDLIFVCNAYHHLTDRSPYFTRLKTALKPGGRVVIVDFYHDERSGDLGFPKDHLVPRENVLREMRQAGYRLLKEHDFLKRQYFLEFGLPTP